MLLLLLNRKDIDVWLTKAATWRGLSEKETHTGVQTSQRQGETWRERKEGRERERLSPDDMST